VLVFIVIHNYTTGEVLKLRNYQEECVLKIKDHFNKNNRQLIQIPTGGGKTFIFLSYISQYVKSSLIVVPSRELLEQVEESSVDFIDNVYARKGNTWKDADHYIVTAASLNFDTTIEYLISKNLDLIVIDEAHHSQSHSYKAFIKRFSKACPDIKILGVTATPERHDQKSLLEIFGKLTYEKNVAELIQEGHLCDAECFRIKTGQKFENRKLSSGDFMPISLKELDNPSRNALVTKCYLENCINKKTIVFCVSVIHAQSLAKTFQDLGYKAKSIHGGLEYPVRKAILKEFKDGTIDIITNCQLLTEGFDESSIEAMIIARPTKSKPLYCQMIGRGLRNHPGKTICSIYELTDNVHNICTFNVFGKQDLDLFRDYENGITLTRLTKTLVSLDVDNLETEIEEVSIFDFEKPYIEQLEATSAQLAELDRLNIIYFNPIRYLEAGFLLWKNRLRSKYFGNN
jgi:superfamily II DNA or RNA helicase